MGPLPRRSPQPFLVAAFVLLSAGFASAAPLEVPWPPVPPLRSFVFVLAATLVACLAALVLEVSLSESSWETAFSDDKFVTGVATWFETESGDNELVLSGCVLWNETDSLNSVLQSQKLVHVPLGEFSLRETAGRETDPLEHCVGGLLVQVFSEHFRSFSFNERRRRNSG